MRPALLRLLKRPSALPVLDSLISNPVGIERLDSGLHFECLRCHSRNEHPSNDKYNGGSNDPVNSKLRSRSTKPPPSFRVYEIQSAQKEPTRSNELNDSAATHNTDHARVPIGLLPERLDYESDIGHTDDMGTRMVDDQAHKDNFLLWEELLRYRQRHYGDKGTLDIWEGLMARVGDVELPVVGERADLFWQSFVDVGLKREPMLRELVSYSLTLFEKTGRRWRNLYESVVGGFIKRGMTQQALHWHKKLQRPHLDGPDDVLRVLEPAIALSSQHKHQSVIPGKMKRGALSPGFWAFRSICSTTDGHQIYGRVISALMRHGLFEDALSMHKFLIQRGDHPQDYEELQPLLVYAKENGPWTFSEKLHSYVADRFPDQGEPAEESPDVSVEARPEDKPLKDDFGARLFATGALAFETIVSGLQMFGVSAIGPHALREMAVRAHGSQDILEKLRQLQDAGISLGDSVFARLLRRLATENREILLSDLIHSDQHPDVLEDARVQESLLISAYMAREWRLYHLTLAVLGEISEVRFDLPSLHFRKHITAGEWSLASKLVDELTLGGQTLSQESIDFLVAQVLTPRKPGARPPQSRDLPADQEVSLVSRILQRVASTGVSIPTDLWVEILKRYGMTNHWDELHDCCLWLARHYSCRSPHVDTSRIPMLPKKSHAGIHAGSRVQSTRQLQDIFDRHMQAAIVAWGFRMRISPQSKKTYNPSGTAEGDLVPWVRGVVLLRELGKNGVELRPGWILRACRQRLAVLYGGPRHSGRRMNRMLRRENPYSVERVVNDLNRAWGEPALIQHRGGKSLQELVNPPSSNVSLQRTHFTMLNHARNREPASVHLR